jgi:hypothetical protein
MRDMAEHPKDREQALDDLRAGFDRDDDDLVRDAMDRLTRRRDTPDDADVVPPRPRGSDEVVCHSCRLVVRRRDMGDAALLVCDDCYRP